MSTNTKTEVNKLIARCRRVGWTVERAGRSGDQWKVYFDDNSSYLIHGSYSDRGAPKLVEKHLESKGLAEKEAALAAGKDVIKSARLTAARKAADAKGERMAKEAALIAKAAGPYVGPVVRPYEWFLADHPAPYIEFVLITPALARQLLKLNVDNIPAHKPTVEYYRTVVAAKRFRMTHQGIAFDTRKILQDGQKRLMAVADSDESIAVACAVGMPPENFKVIDEGRNRSIADLLGKDEVADRNTVGTTVRLIAAYREPYPRAFLKRKTSNETLYDAFKGDPSRLAEAVRWGKQHATQAKIVSSALCAAVYLLREANGQDNQYVQAFLNGLASGTKGDSRVLLDVDDPRLLLRADLEQRRAQRSRLRAVDQLGYILLAWNLIADNSQKGRRIRWNDDRDDIPQITLCADKGERASAVPDKLRGEFTT